MSAELVPRLLRKLTGRVDVARRLGPPTIPAQRKPMETYVAPDCARWLTREEREHIDWLIRALTQ